MAERDLQKGIVELPALKAWGVQVGELLHSIIDIDRGLDVRAATPGPWYGLGLPQQQLSQIAPHFHQVNLVMLVRFVRAATICMQKTMDPIQGRASTWLAKPFTTLVWCYQVSCRGPGGTF